MENTFSKDYKGLWKAAKKTNNVAAMQQVFNDLCTECGIIDPVGEAASQEFGKRAAEFLNSRDKGTDGKKL